VMPGFRTVVVAVGAEDVETEPAVHAVISRRATIRLTLGCQRVSGSASP
jgi:hypothetical protein